MRKMADEMQIYSLHGEVNGGESVQKVSLRQRQVITYIYAQRWNSRWRWITWPRFKARSPPSWVTLTRVEPPPPPPPVKYPTNIRILDRCDARACCPKYLRFDDRSRAVPQAPRLRTHANFTHAESTTHLKRNDAVLYIVIYLQWKDFF